MKQINQLLNRNSNTRNSKLTALFLILVMTVSSSFAFADSNDVIRQANANFKQHFKNAQLISTDVSGKYTKLTFKQDEVIMTAFYSNKGVLLAVVRNILSSDIPAGLREDLKASYNGYWITELFQINGEGVNCYYVSLESADSKVVLRSVDDNNWEIFQETDKK